MNNKKLIFVNEGYYFVNLSFFRDFFCNTQKGGVILSDGPTKLFFYFCYFENNQVQNYGGGSIYVNQNNQNSFSLSYSYGINCSITGENSWGCFLKSIVGEKTNEINDITFTSIVSCAKDEKEENGKASFQLSYGTQQVTYINSSYNYCYYYSGVYFHYSNPSSSVKYSFINNCSSYDYTVLFFISGTYYLYSCNIFYNKAINTNYGVFMSQESSKVTITNCNIYGNKHSTTFSTPSYGKFIISNSFVDKQTYMQNSDVTFSSMKSSMISLDNLQINPASLKESILLYNKVNTLNQDSFPISFFLTFIFLCSL